ncbi:Peroxidase 4 [Hordeum vulgare]|nr:Peroxidase 4 [Hordeum vulgare]
MEAMEELSQLSESISQAASLLADDGPSDDSAPRRPSNFLNAVVLGNVVSFGRNPPAPQNRRLVPRFNMFRAVMADGGASAQLSKGFYSSSCPGALGAVSSVVQSAVANEPPMGASILRLFFHDCFVQGCDGSLLLCMTSLLLTDTYMDYIDKLDGHNEPAVVNYVEDIYKYYKAALNYFCSEPASGELEHVMYSYNMPPSVKVVVNSYRA